MDEPAILELGDRTVNLRDGVVEGHGVLRPAERALLGYLAVRLGETISIEELHQQVWGFSARTRSRTAYVTVSRMRRLLEPDPSRPQHLVAVRGEGYCLQNAVYRQLRADPASVRSPMTQGPLIGRCSELRALAAAPGRLITVVGPAGVGKSRLAWELVSSQGPERVWCRDLACSTDLLADLASMFEMPGPRRPGDLVEALSRAGPGWLLLDNADLLLDQVRAFADHASAAEGLRLIVTSRSPLSRGDETVVRVLPLDVESSTELFRTRQQPGRAEPDAEAELIARADGLPLAIEIYGSRAALVGACATLEALRRGQLLQSRRTDRPGRHRSLHAALAWSWTRLLPEHRDALGALAVLEGPFSARAAEVALAHPRALDVICDLVEQSWVVRETSVDPVSLQLPVPIRDYVRRRAEGDTEAVWARLFGWWARSGGLWRSSSPLLRAPLPEGGLSLEMALKVARWGLEAGLPAERAVTRTALVAVHEMQHRSALPLVRDARARADGRSLKVVEGWLLSGIDPGQQERHWTALLSDDEVGESRPVRELTWIWFNQGRTSEIEDLLAWLESAPSPRESSERRAGTAAFCRAMIAFGGTAPTDLRRGLEALGIAAGHFRADGDEISAALVIFEATRAHFALGQLVGAIDACRTFLALAGCHDVLKHGARYHLGLRQRPWLLRHAGRHTEGLVAAMEALEISRTPRDERLAHLQVALCADRLGDRDRCRAHLARFAGTENHGTWDGPTTEANRQLAAGDLVALGEGLEAALGRFDEIWQRFGSGPHWLRSAIATQEANVRLGLGDVAGAADVLDRLQVQPFADQAAIHTWRSELALRLGDLPRARAEAAAVLRRIAFPEVQSWARALLATISGLEGDLDAARTAIERLPLTPGCCAGWVQVHVAWARRLGGVTPPPMIDVGVLDWGLRWVASELEGPLPAWIERHVQDAGGVRATSRTGPTRLRGSDWRTPS